MIVGIIQNHYDSANLNNRSQLPMLVIFTLFIALQKFSSSAESMLQIRNTSIYTSNFFQFRFSRTFYVSTRTDCIFNVEVPSLHAVAPTYHLSKL